MSNYTPNEADKAAAEKAGLAEEAAHNRRIYPYTRDYEPNAVAKRYFLQGVSYAKASAPLSPAHEEWERLQVSEADKYSATHVGLGQRSAFHHGFDAACTLIAEPLLAENKELRKVYSSTCPECGYAGCVRGRKACDTEIDTLKAELEKARADYAAMKEALEKVLGPYELPFPQSKEDCKPIEIARKRREYDVSVATHALAKLQGAGEKV